MVYRKRSVISQDNLCQCPHSRSLNQAGKQNKQCQADYDGSVSLGRGLGSVCDRRCAALVVRAHLFI